MIDPRYSRNHEQHEAGWRVVLDGECIAELDYLHDDQPCHVFRATLLTTDSAKLDYAFRHVAKRDPEARLVFRNRRTDATASDKSFISRLLEDGTVRIRDFRPPEVLDERIA